MPEKGTKENKNEHHMSYTYLAHLRFEKVVTHWIRNIWSEKEGIINAAYTFSGHVIIMYVLSRRVECKNPIHMYIYVCVLGGCFLLALPIKYYSQTNIIYTLKYIIIYMYYIGKSVWQTLLPLFVASNTYKNGIGDSSI